jgi:hypothetical protein
LSEITCGANRLSGRIDMLNNYEAFSEHAVPDDVAVHATVIPAQHFDGNVF